ncbi:hypothetical protein O7599_03525 [Streptomyces sp. WMMC500]|uniref:hypothetical protein n=1 Tax=Streptomyces sp. WMMC500 TaxID=3015154 RepID=UPI00248C5AA2|nr:hypothetical protein [Streptomyces sp. WMMC500]WBB61638.1 hypothetical protein O7599_03525 [Streptomyces sp. WMMC500]
MDDVGELIERLALWRTGDGGYDETSLRERATVALQERGPEVVPVLVDRLDALLADHAAHLERVGAVTAVWDAWYEEGDALVDEHGVGKVFELERYRTVPSDSLPQQEPRDQHYQDPYDLKQGLVEALRRIGDERAAPVLGRALRDRACIHHAATALRGIHLDGAVPALLDAAASIEPDDMAFPELLRTLEHYGATMAQVRARFEAESGPQARVSLMHVMKTLPGDGAGRPADEEITDALVFLAMSRNATDRYGAVRELESLGALDPVGGPPEDGGDPWDAGFGGMDAPPPAEAVHAAIALAAQGDPPGHDRELVRRLRHMAGEAPSAARAVTAVLAREPRASDAELDLALRLVPLLHPDRVADHLALLRALHGLTSYEPARAGALRALRRDGMLFVLMLHEDPVLREEARVVFDDVAEPDDRERFASYEALRLGTWGRLVRRFRRR